MARCPGIGGRSCAHRRQGCSGGAVRKRKHHSIPGRWQRLERLETDPSCAWSALPPLQGLPSVILPSAKRPVIGAHRGADDPQGCSGKDRVLTGLSLGTSSLVSRPHRLGFVNHWQGVESPRSAPFRIQTALPRGRLHALTRTIRSAVHRSPATDRIRFVNSPSRALSNLRANCTTGRL